MVRADQTNPSILWHNCRQQWPSLEHRRPRVSRRSHTRPTQDKANENTETKKNQEANHHIYRNKLPRYLFLQNVLIDGECWDNEMIPQTNWDLSFWLAWTSLYYLDWQEQKPGFIVLLTVVSNKKAVNFDYICSKIWIVRSPDSIR